jgi:hypothetical protein
MERVINIIGLGASAANTSDTGENWGLCHAYKHKLPMSKLFFMDDFSVIASGDTWIPPVDYTLDKFINDNPKCEIISKHDEKINDMKGNKIADIKAYPLNDALFLCPGVFFTSTIAYTIAYAILEKQRGNTPVDRIRLYGFEMWSGSDANEYNFQRPCVDFWLAYAMGRGIKVEIPWYLLHTVINSQNLYGYVKEDIGRNNQYTKAR